jgi:hypothetical protein
MDLSMDLSAKQAKNLESGVAWLSGIAAWEFQSTNKYDANVPIISQQRFADALANTFGSSAAQSLFPRVSLKSPGASMSPTGIFNKTMAAGIGLFIVDSIANEMVGTEYRSADGLRPIIRGLAKGLLVGGIVGGFFDPYGIQSAGRITGPAGPTLVPLPQLQSYVSSAASLNSRLGG